MKPTPKILALLLCSSLFAAVATTNAQSTWTGTTNNSWGTAGNWDPSGVPGASDNTVFTSASNSGFSIVLGDGNRTVNGITFDSTTGSNSYTINLFDTDLTTRRELRVENVTVEAGNHTISGHAAANEIGSFRPESNAVFHIASGASLDINGRIRHIATTHDHSKTGDGTLIFSVNNGGSNAFQNSAATTGFKIEEGVLRLAALNAFGNSANKYVVSNGAALELAGGFNQTINNGTITLNGTGIAGNGALRSQGGNNNIVGSSTTGGGINLASNSSIGVDAGASLSIEPILFGSGDFEKVGTGTLTLTGANTYTGTTTISAGILQIGGESGRLGNNGTSDTSIASGAELRINSTANFGYDQRGELSGNGTVNILASRRLNFRNNNQTASGNLAFNVDGILAIRSDSNMTSVHLGELSGSGNIQRAGNQLADPVPVVLTIGGKNTNSTYSGNISNISEFAIDKVGTGTLTLEGIYGHGESTTISSGTLLINGSFTNSNNTVTVASDAILGGTGLINGDLTFNSGSFLDVLDFSAPLEVIGNITFGSGFGIASLLGIDWDSLDLDTKYTVISTTQSFGSDDIDNFGFDNRIVVGNSDREAYFVNGSLAVMVTPNPPPPSTPAPALERVGSNLPGPSPPSSIPGCAKKPMS